jgi:hypothetical protein
LGLSTSSSTFVQVAQCFRQDAVVQASHKLPFVRPSVPTHSEPALLVSQHLSRAQLLTHVAESILHLSPFEGKVLKSRALVQA